MNNSDVQLNQTGHQVSQKYISHPGMTRREYFAAKAMQSTIAHPSYKTNMMSPEMVSKRAVEYADALLAELEK